LTLALGVFVSQGRGKEFLWLPMQDLSVYDRRVVSPLRCTLCSCF